MRVQFKWNKMLTKKKIQIDYVQFQWTWGIDEYNAMHVHKLCRGLNVNKKRQLEIPWVRIKSQPDWKKQKWAK